MLKRRVVATLVVRNGIVVQSIGFRSYLPVGRPQIAVEFLNQWGVDEIVLLDISAAVNGRGPDIEMVRSIAKGCFVPLTVGGGVVTLEQARALISSGADKVSFNQAALYTPELLARAAEVFGTQCVVGALDCISQHGLHHVYDYRRRKIMPIDPGEFAKILVAHGAGEIFINSVDRDGSKKGFDLPLIRHLCQSVNVPIICCGGVGCPEHFAEIFQETTVSAAAAANFFHFTEQSVTTTKAAISSVAAVRFDSAADYVGSTFDEDGRSQKKSDKILEEMRFMRIKREVI